MKLYYSKGACSFTVRVIIHELGLNAEFESVNLKTKVTETGEDFLQINPKGTVPVLLTEENELLTENVAILEYLGDKHNSRKLFPLIGNFSRYRAIEWLSFIASDLHKNFGPLFNPEFPAEIKNQFFIPLLKRKFDFVEKKLGENTYLLGDDFTLPDAYMFVMLRWMFHLKFDFAGWPNLSRYFAEVKKRKSVQRALQEEGLA